MYIEKLNNNTETLENIEKPMKFENLETTPIKRIKKNIKQLTNSNEGQGAAEYILLFGGVIVIAIAGLLIYKSYFSENANNLNASQDIESIRNNFTNV